MATDADAVASRWTRKERKWIISEAPFQCDNHDTEQRSITRLSPIVSVILAPVIRRSQMLLHPAAAVYRYTIPILTLYSLCGLLLQAPAFPLIWLPASTVTCSSPMVELGHASVAPFLPNPAIDPHRWFASPSFLQLQAGS